MGRAVTGVLGIAVSLVACSEPPGASEREVPGSIVRLALFNIRELTTEKILEVDGDGRGANPQALAAARIIRRVAPDVLVLNEIDHDYRAVEEGLDLAARRFRDLYLAPGADGLELPWSYAAPNNTGILSGLDLDGDGRAATEADRGTRSYGNDSWGYGTYPGEYSMAVLSRYPIAAGSARTFQRFRWQDLPGHHMPTEFFPPEVASVLRLSSKSHWDLPVVIDGHRLHLFVSHPTPQGFDGEEDKNGRRNFDELKFWVEYLGEGRTLVDDGGRPGGFGSREPFVVIGDLNAAPLAPEVEGEGPFRTSVYDRMAAIDQLLTDPRIQDSGAFATSEGALEHASESPRPSGPPRHFERSTAIFGDGTRIDYILPDTSLEIVDGGVFWPDPEVDPEGAAWAETASDHRLVWLDLRLPESD